MTKNFNKIKFEKKPNVFLKKTNKQTNNSSKTKKNDGKKAKTQTTTSNHFNQIKIVKGRISALNKWLSFFPVFVFVFLFVFLFLLHPETTVELRFDVCRIATEINNQPIAKLTMIMPRMR